MKNEYYPLSHITCHHFENKGGCTFCGYHSSKKSVSPNVLSTDEMVSHFDSFAKENLSDIVRADKLIIAPNGSWFTEVPSELRSQIYDFIDSNDISKLKYESRASLFDSRKTARQFKDIYQTRGIVGEELKSVVAQKIEGLEFALGEVGEKHIVSFGLEVANDSDLLTLNKGCTLADYVHASNKVHAAGGNVCANILIAPPGIEDPISKAFQTAKFGAEEMGASEFLIMPCTPMKGTEGFDAWINAEWNPVSATAASEVYRTIKNQYPGKTVRYLDLRVFTKHGRHGKFKRKAGKWSEEEKLAVREEVKEIAKSIF